MILCFFLGTVPETMLLPSKLCSGYFSVRRFDREGAVRRHMLTAAAILEADWRTAALDYHTLMKLTHILSYGNEADMLQMYRRMCFNVFAHKRDDHVKNFSWIYDAHKDCWHPSPAYVVTFASLKKDLDEKDKLNYKDKFLEPDIFQWESMANLPTSDYAKLNSSTYTHLFIRKVSDENGIVLPFTYVGKGRLTNCRATENGNGTYLFDVIMENELPDYLQYDFGLGK